MKKLAIITLLGIITSIFLISPKTKALGQTQISIDHSIINSVEIGDTFELNGFKYTYIGARYEAKIVSEPAKEKLLVIYDRFNNKSVFYNEITTLEDYTNIEDVVMFSTQYAKNFLHTATFKNLYNANGGHYLDESLKNMHFENYYYVGQYAALYTNIANTEENLLRFNTLTFNNAYYYNFNKPFFERYAKAYNALETSTHKFQLQADDTCKYTQESFYPMEDFEPFYTKGGITYCHYTSNPRVQSTMTKEQFKYIPVTIDSRIKSINLDVITGIGNLDTKTFDNLNIQSLSINKLGGVEGNTLIAIADYKIDFSTIKFKNIYLIPTDGNVSALNTNLSIVEKIYIPEEEKSAFSSLISDPNLASKIQYYTTLPKIDLTFTNNNQTYKSSDDNIDIDITIQSLTKLEKYNINLPAGSYINEFVKLHSLPTNILEQETYSLKTFFIFTKNIDILKAVKEMKPYMLLKGGLPCSEEYQLDVTFDYFDSNRLNFVVTYPNGIHTGYSVNYTVIDSEVGEFFGCLCPGQNSYTLMLEATTIKELTKATDLVTLFINEYLDNKTNPVFTLPITLTKAGVSELEYSRFVNSQDAEYLANVQVIVTKTDLNKAGFKDPYKTLEDEFGKISTIDYLKDKISDNEVLKWGSITISSILGIGILYLLFISFRKIIKWLRK